MTKSLSLALALSVATGTAAAGPLAYVLGNGGSTLYAFDVSAPGSMLGSVAISGAVSSLDDLDFRPLNGALYGYDDDSDQFVIVNTSTGVTTLASSPAAFPTNTSRVGLDFNPTIDRARIVSENGANVVYNPNTGGETQATGLFYVAGDPNAGTNPTVSANAYTNSLLTGVPASTVQYVLDATLDILATLGNNAGTLTTVGSLGVDIGQDAGFDIAFNGGTGTNTAYSLLTVGGVAGLYTIDLGSGAATLVGNFDGALGTLNGLAVTPVPEPASAALLTLGALGLVGARSRRRAQGRAA